MTGANALEDTAAVLLAAVKLPGPSHKVADALTELADLAGTLGFTVADRAVQVRPAPDPGTYIGRGKLEDLRGLVQQHAAELVIFDNDLSPRQSQNIERLLGCMVWDRTQLILEIFARHAHTAESRVQVELARMQYMLPRLVGLWAHLDRERGGIGTSRGMGEKQIQIDRRMVRARIAHLQEELLRIETERITQRKQRSACFQATLVGYTNAGKSTLMNSLTGSSVHVADKLFATLDATTRTLDCLSKPPVVLTDTVGFIRSLPHSLVASFRSTLEHVREADLLLHVVDVSHPDYETHINTTAGVLREIGAEAVPRLLIFNKIDLSVHDAIDRRMLEKKYSGCLCVSALEKSARSTITEAITARVRDGCIARTIRLPYSNSDALADFYAYSIVDSVDYREDAMYIDCIISPLMRRHFRNYLPATRTKPRHGLTG
jgi:GTP-binding protein HflX